MAKFISIRCDVSGADGAETHKLILNGRQLTIDLAPAEFDKLSKYLEKYFQAGTVVEKANGVDSELAQIRAWGLANGFSPAPKGRVSKEIVDAYNAANPQAAQ